MGALQIEAGLFKCCFKNSNFLRLHGNLRGDQIQGVLQILHLFTLRQGIAKFLIDGRLGYGATGHQTLFAGQFGFADVQGSLFDSQRLFGVALGHVEFFAGGFGRADVGLCLADGQFKIDF